MLGFVLAFVCAQFMVILAWNSHFLYSGLEIATADFSSNTTFQCGCHLNKMPGIRGNTGHKSKKSSSVSGNRQAGQHIVQTQAGWNNQEVVELVDHHRTLSTYAFEAVNVNTSILWAMDVTRKMRFLKLLMNWTKLQFSFLWKVISNLTEKPLPNVSPRSPK